RAELRASTDINRDVPFKSVGIIRGCSYVLDVFKQLVKSTNLIIENNQALPGIAVRAPNPIAAISAYGVRQAVFMGKEIDGSGLTIVLGKNAAIAPLVWAKLVPRHRCFIDHLLPSKLVGVPLRQNCAGVRVLRDGQLEWQLLHVQDEAIGRKNRHRYG